MQLRALTPDQLAAVLRGQRLEAGLTQTQAGELVGLLQKTVSVLETAPGGSSIATLFKLLSALNLEMVLQPKRTSPDSPEW
jgi:HTH-type transcriptional regulator/antitoxin HipB